MSDNVNSNLLFEKKYNAVIERSFVTKVDVFLFNELRVKKDIKEIVESQFLDFLITAELAGLYENSWQMNDEDALEGINIVEYDAKIESWYKGNIDLKRKLFVAYANHFKTTFPMSEFIEFYKEKVEERKCFYCGTTEAEILKLRGKGLIKTKRNRGKQMEIDRKNSNMEYSKQNIVLACYWCNNGKSDEFSMEEFKAVGKEIRKIWEVRLKQL